MSRSADPAGAGLTLREALGGEWGFNGTHRIVSAVPGAALVALHEAANPALGPGFVLASVLAQQGIAALLTVPVAQSLRRAEWTLPIPVAFALWALLGASRGLAGGVVAMTAGVAPDFGYRILFWLAVVWLWVPLLAYVLAQLSHRRHLLGLLADTEAARDAARTRAARTSEEIRVQAVQLVRTIVTPALADIRGSLEAAAASSSRAAGDAARMAEICRHLGRLSGYVNRAVETLAEPQPPFRSPQHGRSAPLTAALGFERRRPLLWASGSALAVSAVTGLLVARAGHPGLILALAAAAFAGAAVLALAARSSQGPLRRGHRRWELIRRYLSAALVTAAVFALLVGGRADAFTALLIAVLPITLLYTAALFSFAAGCFAANQQLVLTLTDVDDERSALEARVREEEARIRAQLTALTHGPIQGRLAACAMALNFHAAENSPPERADYVTKAVLEHLAAVSADLAALHQAAVAPARPPAAGHGSAVIGSPALPPVHGANGRESLPTR